ncbi:MAG: hypothetical protein IPH50_14835 [Rhodanobacteraceae bacterium]|nr:hypothetical protein [Rhodanobacteraceae bacterium]
MVLAVQGSDVYVGDYFTKAGGQLANRIARWNGSASVHPGKRTGSGIDGTVHALALFAVT